ncbi:ubiquitin-like protein ATG12 [Panonychus citri]|uniref:ubiquitin-like protein ATG12 n=1 Tax=Panonychus citri TaxID=50023 RepID=UPI0023078A01|nr:ubiquitin-like protein ATG12 [Panonychus citri]
MTLPEGKDQTSSVVAATASSPVGGGGGKIDILLKATGDAPILKKRKWLVEGEQNIGFILNFVKNSLKLNRNESLFIYVNQAFAPAPDQKIKNLYSCFGSDGKLILHYSKTPAWG